MGGVGYLENDDMQFNIARLYRDANVLPIWEGTTDMMADDSILRVLYGKTRTAALASLTSWVQALCIHMAPYDTQANAVGEWWLEFKTLIAVASKEEAEMKARAIMTRLVDIVQGLLLLVDAQNDGDEVAHLVMETWFAQKFNASVLQSQSGWKDQVAADIKIVFGKDGTPLAGKAKL